MGLLDRLKALFAARQKTAAEEYIELLCRVDTDEPGDVDRLAALMNTLHRTPANLEADAATIRRAVELRGLVARIPELTRAYCDHENSVRLARYRCEQTIETARRELERRTAEVKAEHRQNVNAFFRAREARNQLEALLPELRQVLGSDDGFVNVCDPAEERAAFDDAKAWLQREMQAEALTTV